MKLNLKSFLRWQMTSKPNWVVVDPTVGDGGTYEITVEAEDNPKYEERAGVVRFEATNGETAELSLLQMPKPAEPVMTPATLAFTGTQHGSDDLKISTCNHEVHSVSLRDNTIITPQWVDCTDGYYHLNPNTLFAYNESQTWIVDFVYPDTKVTGAMGLFQTAEIRGGIFAGINADGIVDIYVGNNERIAGSAMFTKNERHTLCTSITVNPEKTGGSVSHFINGLPFSQQERDWEGTLGHPRVTLGYSSSFIKCKTPLYMVACLRGTVTEHEARRIHENHSLEGFENRIIAAWTPEGLSEEAWTDVNGLVVPRYNGNPKISAITADKFAVSHTGKEVSVYPVGEWNGNTVLEANAEVETEHGTASLMLRQDSNVFTVDRESVYFKSNSAGFGGVDFIYFSGEVIDTKWREDSPDGNTLFNIIKQSNILVIYPRKYNETGKSIIRYIDVTGETGTVTIKITQFPAEITATPTTVEWGYGQRDQTFSIETNEEIENIELTAEDVPGHFIIERTDANQIVVSVAAANTSEKRISATCRITGKSGRTINVKLRHRAQLMLLPTSDETVWQWGDTTPKTVYMNQTFVSVAPSGKQEWIDMFQIQTSPLLNYLIFTHKMDRNYGEDVTVTCTVSNKYGETYDIPLVLKPENYL